MKFIVMVISFEMRRGHDKKKRHLDKRNNEKKKFVYKVKMLRLEQQQHCSKSLMLFYFILFYNPVFKMLC